MATLIMDGGAVLVVADANHDHVCALRDEVVAGDVQLGQHRIDGGTTTLVFAAPARRTTPTCVAARQAEVRQTGGTRAVSTKLPASCSANLTSMGAPVQISRWRSSSSRARIEDCLV